MIGVMVSFGLVLGAYQGVLGATCKGFWGHYLGGFPYSPPEGGVGSCPLSLFISLNSASKHRLYFPIIVEFDIALFLQVRPKIQFDVIRPFL